MNALPASTKTSQEPAPTNHPPSVHQDILNGLVDNPEFKRLVRDHAKLHIKQALKEERLRRSHVPNQFIPRMDVLDDDLSPRIIATFELPGVRTRDFRLEVINDDYTNTLLLCGQRKLYLQRTPGIQACIARRSLSPSGIASSNARPSVPYHRVKLACELQYGAFSRAVHLPHGIKKHHISARFENGMLVVTWPRTAPFVSEPESAPNDTNNITVLESHNDSTMISVGGVKDELLECQL